jgi:CubicO group peptidase (beta-lactamase class C family)
MLAPAAAQPKGHNRKDTNDTTRIRALETELGSIHQRLRLPGLSVGIVEDGALSWFHGFGYADVAKETPVTKDTPYNLASLTKTFASTIVMQLVEQGRLDLDSPASEFGIRLDSPGTITVRHLLSHTSDGMPGEEYNYNGSRFSLIDHVIREVTGQSFKEAVRKIIIEPLGLQNTGGMRDPLPTTLAKPYRLDASGELGLSAYKEGSLNCSAGMVSSIADYAKYIAAIESNTFVQEETQAQAFTPTRSTKGDLLPYGLGWFVEEVAGTKLVWHYGYWDCTSTLVLMVPEKRLTFIAFTNTDHLSRGFGISSGSVLASPVAMPFLKNFIFNESQLKWPAIDWQGSPDEIAVQFNRVKDERVRELLSQELWVNLRIPSTAGDSGGFARMQGVYQLVLPCRPLSQLQGTTEIARLVDVGPDQDVRRKFSLENRTAVRLLCSGEFWKDQLGDYGWIEEASTGQVVWRMQDTTTMHGGGHPANRLVSETYVLAPGDYHLRYRTDGGHDFEGWNARPPDGLFWGIILYEEDESVEAQTGG